MGEYASKFNDPSDIKKALQELGPNSTKFNNAVSTTPTNQTLSIEHVFPDEVGYGYKALSGANPSTLTSTPMKKVVATYNYQNGEWVLSTMHPDII